MTLHRVKAIRGAIPRLAQRVDVENIFVFALLHHQRATVWHRIANLGVANAFVFEIRAQVVAMVVAYLYHHARVLCEEVFHHIVAC